MAKHYGKRLLKLKTGNLKITNYKSRSTYVICINGNWFEGNLFLIFRISKYQLGSWTTCRAERARIEVGSSEKRGGNTYRMSSEPRQLMTWRLAVGQIGAHSVMSMHNAEWGSINNGSGKELFFQMLLQFLQCFWCKKQNILLLGEKAC